jgi:DTW domain-containing protein YfiP
MMLSPHSPFYCAHCIHCRLSQAHCVCCQIERIELPFNINLCCHSKEWQRNDNTGQWALLSSANIRRIKWHRKTELIFPTILTAEITAETGHYLLFPSDDAQDIQQVSPSTAQAIKQLWVIDGTWQEAQKMLRQSPWLKALPRVKIQASPKQALESHFQLRRNQQGLCTLEAIEAAINNQAPLAAQALNRNFHLFQNALLGLLR